MKDLANNKQVSRVYHLQFECFTGEVKSSKLSHSLRWPCSSFLIMWGQEVNNTRNPQWRPPVHSVNFTLASLSLFPSLFFLMGKKFSRSTADFSS